MCFSAYFLKIPAVRNKTPLRLAPWLWTEQSGPCAAHSGTSWMSFLVFMMHHVSQSLCVSFSQHFMMYILHLLRFFLKWFDYVLHHKLKINHPLFIFCGNLYGWVGGRVGNFLQKVQSDWNYYLLFQGAFFTLISCAFFSQFRCKLFLFTYLLCCISTLILERWRFT